MTCWRSFRPNGSSAASRYAHCPKPDPFRTRSSSNRSCPSSSPPPSILTQTHWLPNAAALRPPARVFVAEPVRFVAEARCFVLAGDVRDVSLHAGEATVEGAAPLTRQVAHCRLLPKTCLVDIGFMADRGWAVVEANAAWGAGLNDAGPRR